MIATERDIALTYDPSDPNLILREYSEIMESLQQNLSSCKIEQKSIRSVLETYRQENKATDMAIREYFFRIHTEECCDNNLHEKEIVKNLEERIASLQMEKDSVFQLWQMSLKAIDSLEEELKVLRTDHNGIKISEEQINSIKGTYNEAAKVLEEKLFQAKENLIKHQALWENSKEKINELKKEKEDITSRLTALQNEWMQKDRSNQQEIESLKMELAIAKAEIQKQSSLKVELETKLQDIKRFAANVVAKDEETKCKMTEAIELVEFAIKEKDMAVQREMHTLDEKAKVEKRLTDITEQFNNMLQDEVSKVKNVHDQNVKKYLLEIKELKTEIRQTVTLLDRSQRECRLVEEELTKVRQFSEDSVYRSNMKISELERRLKDTELQLQNADEDLKKKYNFESKQMEDMIEDLRRKLAMSNDKLKLLEQQNINSIEDSMKQIDAKAKEAVEQYNSLEYQLNKTLGDKKSLLAELQSLQSTFSNEIQKRDHEKYFLEKKIFELEVDLQRTKSSIQNAAHKVPFVNQLEEKGKDGYNANVGTQFSDQHNQSLLSNQLHELQEKFDKRMKELSHHVEVHQKLSKKWKEEAKSLATKFQVKSKELRAKVSALRKENNELQQELLICRQYLAQYGIQTSHRCEERVENR